MSCKKKKCNNVFIKNIIKLVTNATFLIFCKLCYIIFAQLIRMNITVIDRSKFLNSLPYNTFENICIINKSVKQAIKLNYSWRWKIDEDGVVGIQLLQYLLFGMNTAGIKGVAWSPCKRSVTVQQWRIKTLVPPSGHFEALTVTVKPDLILLHRSLLVWFHISLLK